MTFSFSPIPIFSNTHTLTNQRFPTSFIQISSNLFPTVTPYNLQAIMPCNVTSSDNISIMANASKSEPFAAADKMSLNNLLLLHWSWQLNRFTGQLLASDQVGLQLPGQLPHVCNHACVK